MTTTTELQLVPLNKLVPYQNNARTHSPEQINKLRASLREFGFINPVIIDRNYGIIAGHGRAIAAREEGIKEVPCVFADHLTEAQKKAYIIADNRMALDAGWDEELLRVEIEALQADAFDLALTGFDEKELSKLFDDGKEAEDDDFDVDAELQNPTVTKPGDVWTLGRHRLVCGDSTKPETYEVLMNGRKANLVVTDPPYNVNYEGTAGKIKNDNMASEKFYDFLFDAFSCMEKVMADDASIYVFHADTEGLNFRKAFDAAGFYLSGCCIWKKPSLVLGRSPYQWQHEPCLFGWKKKGKHQWYSDRKQTTIWEFEKTKKNTDHPTMKPMADDDAYNLNINLPRSLFTDTAIENLQKLVKGKESLLKKALGTDSVSVIVTEDTVEFPWFNGIASTDEHDAYLHLVTAIAAMAREQKRISVQDKEVDNEKYAFRCFLLRLGFIGDEFKWQRKFLLRNLSGSAAFKSGKAKEANECE